MCSLTSDEPVLVTSETHASLSLTIPAALTLARTTLVSVCCDTVSGTPMEPPITGAPLWSTGRVQPGIATKGYLILTSPFNMPGTSVMAFLGKTLLKPGSLKNGTDIPTPLTARLGPVIPSGRPTFSLVTFSLGTGTVTSSTKTVETRGLVTLSMTEII